MKSMINKKLLLILVCPLCKGRLIYNAKKEHLVCRIDNLAYQIKQGIPIMVPEQAIRLKGE